MRLADCMSQCIAIIFAALTAIAFTGRICKTDKFVLPSILDGWAGVGICFAGSLLFLLLSVRNFL